MATEHFNRLTPEEHERLSLLIEECSEVIGIACKILRHGYESKDPTKPETMAKNPTNRELLIGELGHVGFAVSMMLKAGDIDEHNIQVSTNIKSHTVKRWLHHQ